MISSSWVASSLCTLQAQLRSLSLRLAGLGGRANEGKVEAFIKDKTLVDQLWRDTKKSIGDLIKETSAKVGENIQVRRFVRYQMGEE